MLRHFDLLPPVESPDGIVTEGVFADHEGQARDLLPVLRMPGGHGRTLALLKVLFREDRTAREAIEADCAHLPRVRGRSGRGVLVSCGYAFEVGYGRNPARIGSGDVFAFGADTEEEARRIAWRLTLQHGGRAAVFEDGINGSIVVFQDGEIIHEGRAA